MFLAHFVEYLSAAAIIPRRYHQMKNFTTVAVIAALTLATQAFAMGGSTKGGPSMSSTMSKSTMKTGTTMTAGTHTMTATAPMSGTGAMTTTMPAAGTTKTMMTTASPMQPATTK